MNVQFVTWALGLLLLMKVMQTLQTGKRRGYFD
jgi:hypothetical protein